MLSLSLRSTRSSDYSGTRPGEPGGAGSHLGARLGVCVPSLSEGMLMVLTRSYLRFHEFQGPPCFHLFFQILPPPTSAPQRPPLEVMLQAHLLHETSLSFVLRYIFPSWHPVCRHLATWDPYCSYCEKHVGFNVISGTVHEVVFRASPIGTLLCVYRPT